MGLLQLSETCLILTMKTLTASNLPVPNKTRPVPCCSHIQLLDWVQFTCPCCLARSPSLVSHISEASTKQPAALLPSWSSGEAASARFLIKVQTWRLLCFQEILQRTCGATAIARPPQGDSSCRTEGGECGDGFLQVPQT